MRSRQLRAMKVLCPELLCASAVAIYLSSESLSESLSVRPSKSLLLKFSRAVESARVELDDELFADRQGQILAGREGGQLALEVVLVELQPLGDPAAIDGAEALEDAGDLLGAVADLDLIARPAKERGEVDL